MREGALFPFASHGPQQDGAPGGPEDLRRKPSGRVRLALNKKPRRYQAVTKRVHG